MIDISRYVKYKNYAMDKGIFKEAAKMAEKYFAK